MPACDVGFLLEKVCEQEEERVIRSENGVNSYTITFCTNGKYSFTLSATDTGYTRTCQSACELQASLLQALENIGEEDAEGALADHLAPLARLL